MKTAGLLARVLLVCAAALPLAQASDWTGVYARVDRVVLAPNSDSPDTIQVFGVFSLADPKNSYDYQPAARGYLYFKLGENPEAARMEWKDLKAVAGTSQIVAFGSRSALRAQLRKAGEDPKNPDAYRLGNGVRKVRSNTDYEPVRSILEYKD